ncbi:UDP-N-acetylmuramoyl-tripeptide--D-alanyl-D-alanine ligase [Phycisphaerales bacterium AB-hyl4]|uniref:UDP-N-acetylmuramoyl-tripeptide--D-alanyl-D-alanine ligase n=1 Tax=Natronomicrosphaera hydrolytica TaxID=3242702 RepID=A0ABV4U4T5_9BACT
MHTPATIPPQPPSSDHESDDALGMARRFWTPRHIAEVTGGRWLRKPSDLDRPLAGLSIDTRTIGADEVFLAIVGPRFDGHNFLPAAAAAGAAMAIVEEVSSSDDVADSKLPLLHVDSAVEALHRLAGAWRDVLAAAGCRVIAVVGSNGKTTTRHLVHTALNKSVVSGSKADDQSSQRETRDQKAETAAQRLEGTQSPRSFNNHLGVPLTLLAARAEHDFVVAEIGTNHPGEIAALASIARPSAAVITSVGREHMEHFGTLEAVAREEAAVLDHLVEQGLAVIEAEAMQRIAGVRAMPEHVHVVRFGEGDDADVRYENLSETPVGLRFDVVGDAVSASNQTSKVGREAMTLPLLGRHNASNALAAVVVGRWMGVSLDELAKQLAGTSAVPGRLEVRRVGLPTAAVLVLHDAYNANPDSMQAAIRTLVNVQATTADTNQKPKTKNEKPKAAAPRRIAILGDMAELGKHGPDAHRQLGEELVKQGDAIDLVLLVGQLTLFTAEALSRRWPNERVHVLGPLNDAAAQRIADMLKPGDIVLLKASRSVALERVLPAIEQRFAT